MQVRRVCVSEESYERELKLEMSEVYDCIVVGAGIQGSCTAYQLAKNKQKTLLLEQVGAEGYAVFLNHLLSLMIHHLILNDSIKTVSKFLKAEYSPKERNKCKRQH